MPVQVAINKPENTLTITLPLQSARASASGKTRVIASTHGCHVTDLKRLGRPIVVTANAFVYSNSQPKQIMPGEAGGSSATLGKIKSAKDRRPKRPAVVSRKSRGTQNPKTPTGIAGV